MLSEKNHVRKYRADCKIYCPLVGANVHYALHAQWVKTVFSYHKKKKNFIKKILNVITVRKKINQMPYTHTLKMYSISKKFSI